MNPPLYNDILFLIFDQVFISFKKEISIEFKKEMEKITEEFNRNGTSAAARNIIKNHVKNSKITGFIYSCESYFSGFEKYKERFLVEESMMFLIDRSFDNCYRYYDNSCFIAKISYEMLTSGNYFSYDFDLIKKYDDQLNYTINDKNYTQKLSGRIRVEGAGRYKKGERKYKKHFSLFEGWPCETYIDYYFNQKNEYNRLVFYDRDEGDLFETKISAAGLMSFKNDKINIANIKRLISYFKTCYPAKEELVLYFLKKKRYDFHYDSLKLLKNFFEKLEDFYEKYEIKMDEITNFINKKR
jgi:hypothetical protein